MSQKRKKLVQVPVVFLSILVLNQKFQLPMNRPVLKNILLHRHRQHLILLVIMKICLLSIYHFFVNKKLDDKQKIQLLQNVWVPDNNYNFSNQPIGNQKRKFNILWLTKYKWLTYSKIEDSAFCKVCVLF